jgi:hypothetical protein
MPFFHINFSFPPYIWSMFYSVDQCCNSRKICESLVKAETTSAVWPTAIVPRHVGFSSGAPTQNSCLCSRLWQLSQVPVSVILWRHSDSYMKAVILLAFTMVWFLLSIPVVAACWVFLPPVVPCHNSWLWSRLWQLSQVQVIPWGSDRYASWDNVGFHLGLAFLSIPVIAAMLVFLLAPLLTTAVYGQGCDSFHR